MKRTPLKRYAPLRAKRNKVGVRVLPDVKPEAVKVYPDGREVCQNNAAGIREYNRRKHEMAKRQGGFCCLDGYAPMCKGRMFNDVTFDHEEPRGMGGANRDDRIEVNGKWINGAAHEVCNNWKGSKRIPYNVPSNSFARTA